MSKNKRYLTIDKFNAKFIATVLIYSIHLLRHYIQNSLVSTKSICQSPPKRGESVLQNKNSKRDSSS